MTTTPEDVAVLREAAGRAPLVLSVPLGETVARWLNAEADCHASADEAGQAAVDLLNTLDGDPSDTASFRVVVSTLPSAVAFARQMLVLPTVSPVPDADGLRDLIHSCAQRGIKDWDRDYDSRAAGPVTDYVMGALHYVFGRWEASLRAEVERLRGENAELDAARRRLRRELDRVSAEATLNAIPDDAEWQIADVLGQWVELPTGPDEPEVVAVADLVRSWLSTPATDHAPAADPTEYCAGLTWTVRHVPPGTIDPEDTDEPIRPGWWVLGVDEDPDLPVVQVWLGETLPATAPAPAAADQVARLQELLSYIELHVAWRWLSGKCTTEQREMWADAVDRFSDGEPRADRWWREPTAPQAPAEPEPCGQVHDGAVCTKPRVPTTNGCWGHYGPEPDPDAQYACDASHHVVGQVPCPHCQPIPGRPQAPAEPMAWTEHDVEVVFQDDGWATAECHTCGASIGESTEDTVEDWVDQHRADTLRPAGEEQ